ncbi:MAG TPA: hypothetical protein VGP72_21475 [Planctomycetota bacterium]|jgi:hypothetical protein
MTQSANIDTPDVIREFRTHLVKFDENCREGIAGVHTDAQRVQQWLQQDQLRYWKQQLRDREKLVHQARQAYNLARFGSETFKKNSYVDEQKVLKRAERAKAEAEEKITHVKKWSTLLDQQMEKLLGPIDKLGYVLDEQTPKSLAKLDLMIRSLEDYLKPGQGAQ